MDERLSSAAIFARLGIPPRDANFELVNCELCGRQYLADHETLQVYTDPADLSRSVFNAVGEPWPPCLQCGAANWGVLVAEKVAPEWQWACRTN
jgi:hypothetical protein